MERISERWRKAPLLADGAMGTLLFARRPASTSVELLNLTAADDVERAHREYVDAGAQLIETNTFAANRIKLGPHEAAHRVGEINAAGVAIARRAAQDRAYVAASVGPIGALLRPIGSIDPAEALDVFREHVASLVSAGPDLLLLETFGDLAEALIAVAAAHEVAPELPLLASLSVLDDGRTAGGDALLPAFARLRDAGADAVGINCAVGPQAIYDALAPIVAGIDGPLAVMPNAGYPHRVDDRTVYESAPAYFARFARAFLDLGATIVGGCCGTTPAHIAAMAPEFAGKDLQQRRNRTPSAERRSDVSVRPRPQPDRRPRTFETDLGTRFVTTVEIAPPRSADPAEMLEAANAFASVGVDAVHVADDPSGRPSMSGVAAAHLIMRETRLAAILHVSCRDRNLVGLQSELLGAAALGIPAIVALTGDPSNVGDFPKTTSVFDVTALGLTRILRDLNDGRDQAGDDIGTTTRFRIGAVVNPVPRDLAAECARLEEKIEAGADFAITQPVYETAALAPFLERARRAGLPVLVGLLPLRSFAHAEFLHNEVPGFRVPDAIRERIRTARDQAKEGARVARDLFEEFARTKGIAGVLIVSRARHEETAEIVRQGLRWGVPKTSSSVSGL